MVVQERLQRGDQGAGIARRAQAGIQLVNIPFTGLGGKDRDQLLGQLGKVFMIGNLLIAVRLSLVIVDENDIQIGVVVQLTAPQLAHADDRQVGPLRGAVTLPGGQAKTNQFGHGHAVGLFQADLRQIGQLAGDAALPELAMDVVQADPQNSSLR